MWWFILLWPFIAACLCSIFWRVDRLRRTACHGRKKTASTTSAKIIPAHDTTTYAVIDAAAGIKAYTTNGAMVPNEGSSEDVAPTNIARNAGTRNPGTLLWSTRSARSHSRTMMSRMVAMTRHGMQTSAPPANDALTMIGTPTLAPIAAAATSLKWATVHKVITVHMARRFQEAINTRRLDQERKARELPGQRSVNCTPRH